MTRPVLMLNGRYDYLFPLDSSQIPMFKLLGAPDADKRHVIYEAGHFPLPRGAMIRETLDWLDRYMGPVERIATSATSPSGGSGGDSQ